MRNSKLFYPLFLFVLALFVIPPIVAPFFASRQDSFVAHYPPSVFLNGGIAFLIYYFSQVKPKIFDTPPFPRERLPFLAYLYAYSSNALVCFGVLCLSSVGFEAISFLIRSNSGIHEVLFPSDFLGFVNFFFGVIFAAFFEEVIYRFFLPSALKVIFCKNNLTTSVFHKDESSPNATKAISCQKRRIKELRLWLFFEVISVILFALGHLYLGIFGFLNALVCGIALRVCMVRTKSLWIPFGIHAIYNMLTIVLFSLA